MHPIRTDSLLSSLTGALENAEAALAPRGPPSFGAAPAQDAAASFVERFNPTPYAPEVAPSERFVRGSGLAYDAFGGAPLFRQGDPEWGTRRLNESPSGAVETLARKGCLVSSVAMALSELSGQLVTPAVVDRHLDARGGYDGANRMSWERFGTVAGTAVRPARLREVDVARLDAELDAGRPVVVGVHYRGGGGTDHWLCLTERRGDRYFANDPASGEVVELRRGEEGTLERPGKHDKAYRFTGDAVVFVPGEVRHG